MAKTNAFNYFDYFREMAQHSVKASTYLRNNFNDFDHEAMDEMLRGLHNEEHAADLRKHDMTEHLLREFLPPIDRDDVMHLSSALDDLVDDLEDVMLKTYMFDVRSIRPDAKEFSAVVDEICDHLFELMNDFEGWKKNLDTVKERIRRINSTEEKGDKLYIAAVRRLYTETASPVEIAVWKDIFDAMEKCCDDCEHVADAVEMVMMKNS